MKSPPFSHAAAAYQLHYYLCLRAKWNKPLFSASIQRSLEEHLKAICEQCDYHILELRPQAEHIRLLLSLRPEHSVAEAVKKIKGNLSRLLCGEYSDLKPGRIWSRGYFAKSSGTVGDEVVARYIAEQAAHHGYVRGAASLVSVYDEREPVPQLWRNNHASFNLTHHAVLETDHNALVFDHVTGEALIEYWLRVAAKKEFEIAQVRILPDHCHLRVRLLPAMSILECVLGLMNNSWAMMNQRFWGVLKQTEAWNVWRPSFYAGTTGDVTTAELKSYISGGRPASHES